MAKRSTRTRIKDASLRANKAMENLEVELSAMYTIAAGRSPYIEEAMPLIIMHLAEAELGLKALIRAL